MRSNAVKFMVHHYYQNRTCMLVSLYLFNSYGEPVSALMFN